MRPLIVSTICLLVLYGLCLTSFATTRQSSAGTHSKTPLTNQDILLMTRSKFDDATIVKAIQTFETNFDVSVAALMKLKDAGVTQVVMQAMLATAGDRRMGGTTEHPSTTGATASPVSVDLPVEVGVYVQQRGKLIEMEPEIVNWRTGGVLKSMATVGLDKGHVNGTVTGPHSNLKLSSPSYMGYDALEFYVYCVEGGSAAEYQLLHFWEKGDRREFRAVTGGVLHESGGAKVNVVSFEYEKIASRIYKIKVPRLARGEYGLLAPGAAASANVASQGKVYTFQIVE